MISEQRLGAFEKQLWELRSEGYLGLDWVNAPAPLNFFLSLADPKGDEIVIDVGTGSQAVLKAIEPLLTSGGRIIGFDISEKMLSLGPTDKCNNRVELLLADACKIPFFSNFADIVVARMVLHHLLDPTLAIREASRILKPGGKLIVGEHVGINEEVRNFEKPMFDIKEPGRHLWIPSELEDIVRQAGFFSEIQTYLGILKGYNMSKWMKNSGLSLSVQQRVLDYFATASGSVREKLNIVLKDDNGDILMDGYYCCVVAKKKN